MTHAATFPPLVQAVGYAITFVFCTLYVVLYGATGWEHVAFFGLFAAVSAQTAYEQYKLWAAKENAR